MSQVPDFGAAPPPSAARRWLPWILGMVGVLLLTPCLCCSGCLVVASFYKELKISNGQHLGGSTINVQFDYQFAGEDRGMPKAYFIVAQSAYGVRREQSVGGIGVTRIPLRGSWRFFDGVPLPESDRNKPIRVWVEAEDHRGERSTISITLKIMPKP
jgi:hypothetical protein